MRPWLARAAGCVALVLAGAGPAAAQTGPPMLSVLVNQVVALFPRVNGDVLEVQGEAVTIAIGKRDGLIPGVELALYREGRELRHPKTGEVLGKTEQAVGRMLVQEVFEAYATGKAAPGSDVKPGDRARVSAGKIKLTLLSLVDGVKDTLAEAATYELVEALSRTGRFQVALGDAVNVWLAEQGVKRQDVLDGKGLAPVAERFKLEYLLVVAYTRVERRPYMDVRLFAFPGASALLTTALFVPPSIKPAAKGDFSAAGKPKESQTPNVVKSLLARLLTGELDAGTYSSGESQIPLKELAKFPYVVIAMDVAVAPQDGVPRMVVTDGAKVFLYKIVERVLEAEWTFQAAALGRVFSVQLGDFNGDGVLDVVVNRYSPNPAVLMRSFILTTQAGKPATLVDGVNDILLAVDPNGEGVKKTLWAQPFDQKGFFKAGDVQRNSRIRIASADGEDLWRSAAPVGGGGVKLEVMTNAERGGRSYIYTSEPQPIAVDLDGDGVEEIVVPQNQLPGRMAVVYKGPAGYRFQTVNSGFEGTLTALGAIPGDGPGSAPTLVIAVVRYQNVLNTTGETQIIVTTGE